MTKCALLYLVVGVTITTASYAFFNEFMSMPGQMMQMVQPQKTLSQPCVCKCN
jgi:hypothetical protein